jgi:tRNA nucleotidyltransferase (CCA-adding enzyme)
MSEKQTALAVIESLEKADFKAFIVGGAVRDLVLGLVPKDFDVATDATPQQIREIFPNSPFVGESFGVVLVKGIEVATFRTDKNHDGRHCDVEFVTSLEEDLSRRDFTFNAMAMDKEGNITDPFGGQADLNAGLVRFVGNPEDRLAEDYLRALRAVRFASRFEFQLEEKTLAAIQKSAHLIQQKVSPERVFAEFVKSCK